MIATLSFVAFNESTPASLHCMRVDAGGACGFVWLALVLELIYRVVRERFDSVIFHVFL